MKNEDEHGKAHGRTGTTAPRTARIPGIRWIPVPLALLAATVGWLVYGTVLGADSSSSCSRWSG
jgi:hypothetical protein